MRALTKKSSLGFTLIELLIVLVIISIVTGALLLNFNPNRNRELINFVNELSQTITLAEEQAMLTQRVIGLKLNEANYQFLIYQPEVNQKKTTWLPARDPILGPHPIPSQIEVRVQVGDTAFNETKDTTEDSDEEEDNGKENLPEIIISTSGDITPFNIYVGKKGEPPRYLIKGKTDGTINIEALPSS